MVNFSAAPPLSASVTASVYSRCVRPVQALHRATEAVRQRTLKPTYTARPSPGRKAAWSRRARSTISVEEAYVSSKRLRTSTNRLKWPIDG